jgi:ABC-type lipoprotein export system ATPase subunit
MRIHITLKNIQHIREMQFEVDSDRHALICITGKNGAGKTTLVKAIRNLTNADTFASTTSGSIAVGPLSSITYQFDGSTIFFGFDPTLGALDSSDDIPESLRTSIATELSIPFGDRFTWYPRVSDADEDIRRARVLGRHSAPVELRSFLRDIYQTPKFDELAEVSVRKKQFYFLPLTDDKYLREDYLSTGEYFLISLYRQITRGRRLIVVDEIDISLDAAAQVRLVRNLRQFSKAYGTCFVFTTHSLAMMRTLDPQELYYMGEPSEAGPTPITNVPYNYINTLLFGFRGWDKYILTEDEVLGEFLEFVVRRYCGNLFYSYKIIFVGGSSNTTDLMHRNATENFLAESNDVITVLDGDQRIRKHSHRGNTYCIPMESIEKALLADCLTGTYADRFKLSDVLPEVDSLVRYLRQAVKEKKYEPINHSAMLMSPAAALDQFFSAARAWLACRVARLAGQKAKSLPEVATERQFKGAARKVFDHLTKRKIVSRMEIHEHLTGRYERQVLTFAAELRAFLTLPVAGTSTLPAAGEKAGGEP